MKRKFTKLLATLALLTCSALTLACCVKGGKDSSPTGGDSSQGDTTSSIDLGNSSTSNSSSDDADDIRAFWIDVSYEEVDIFVGEQFTVTAELYKGSTLIDGAVFEWTTENSDIATVNNGTITVNGVGVCDIIVSAVEYEGVQSNVQVNGKMPLTLDLSKQNVELALLEMEGYPTTAEVTFEAKWQGEPISNPEVTLEVSNDNVLAEVQSGKIVLTANKVGTTVVKVKYDYGNGMKTSTNINVEVVKPIVQTGETYLLSTGHNSTIDLSLLNGTANVSATDVVKVYTDETEFPIASKEGTVVTVSNTASMGSDGSVEKTVIVETADVRYAVAMKGYTKVLRTAKDFDDMKELLVDTTTPATKANSGLDYCKIIKGYFILANDIDFAEEYPDGYASPFSYADVGYASTGYTHGWSATFDGNGYTISNVKLINSSTEAGNWCNSLFGMLEGSDGVIKNVAFKNCSLAAGMCNSAFLANIAVGKIENVYLDVTLGAAPAGQGNSAFVGMAPNQGVNHGIDTNISNVTINLGGSLGANDRIIGGEVIEGKNCIANLKDGFVVIGAAADAQFVNGKTCAEVQTANADVKVYASFIAAAQDTGLTSCGSTGFESNGVTFVMTWNGNVVYENVIAPQMLNKKAYSLDDKTIDFGALGITVDSSTKITRNGVPVNFTLDGQVATLTGDSVLCGAPQEATGATVDVMVITATKAYQLPLQVCSDIIYTAKDFDAMKRFLVDTATEAKRVTEKVDGVTVDKKDENGNYVYVSGHQWCTAITGYYLLGADIDFATDYANGYVSPFSYVAVGYKDAGGWTNGWRATFDGNGHTISNLNLLEADGGNRWRVSLFGVIGGDGVVKNVAFKNCSMDTRLLDSAFFANRVYGVVDNVYAEITDKATSGNAAMFIGYGTTVGVENYGYTSISNVTVVVHGLRAGNYVMRAANAEKVSAIKGPFVVIGADEASVFGGDSSYAINSNIKAYASVGAASKDTNLTECGDATFAKAGSTYYVYWNNNDEAIYSEAIVETLDQALYSLDDTVIDFEAIGITVDGNTKITRDGTAVAFTLNGQKATITGDSVLNGTVQDATGAVVDLVVETADVQYILPVKVCSDVLYTAKDFDNMKRFLIDSPHKEGAKMITGYYILGSNLNFATDYADGYSSPFGWRAVGAKTGAYSHGWAATFDGNGYTIENVTLVETGDYVWQTSLFGAISIIDSDIGTVKNVAFKNCALGAGLYNSAFLANYVYGVIDNVYLDVEMTTTNNAKHGNSIFVGMDATKGIESTDNKTSISNVTIVVSGTFGQKDVVFKGATDKFGSLKGSIVIIGAAEDKITDAYATLTDVQAVNANVKAYSATTADLAACGDATFAVVNGELQVSWKGKVI